MRFFVFYILLFSLLGCGYHFPGRGGVLPAEVKQLYIPLFVNKTLEPQLENKMTSRISEVFSRNKKIFQVENPQHAEAVFEGTIRSYNNRALSYDQNDDISEYRSTMIVDARLRQVETDQLLWEGTASWNAEYLAADDKAIQEDLEQQAIDEIVLRLAEELLYKMLDDF